MYECEENEASKEGAWAENLYITRVECEPNGWLAAKFVLVAVEATLILGFQ